MSRAHERGGKGSRETGSGADEPGAPHDDTKLANTASGDGGAAAGAAASGASERAGGFDDPSERGGLASGDRLGRYTIAEVLGEGGMGVVYAAHDPDLDRKVAIKVLRPAQQTSDAARARLLREARAMAKLSHPNVITVHEVGTVSEIDFVAMELIRGDTLDKWARGRSWRDILRASLAAGRGLAAAHRAGLVHRDFKPSNVLVDTQGRVAVTDFGLARASRGDREEIALSDTITPDADPPDALAPITRTGALAGTPAYMAPEQHEGDEADERSDQFSFCVALYEALYGARPFTGDSLEELRRETTSKTAVEPPRRREHPARVRRALRRGLSPRREDRYPSMEALLGEIEAALSRRRRSALALALGASGLVVGAATASLLASDDARAAACDPDAEFAAMWDAGTRELVREALTEAGGGGGSRVAESTAERLDTYAESWKTSYREVCSAYEHGEVSDEDYYLARRCFAERRSELRSLVDGLLEADADSAEHAVEAAQSLPLTSACADLEALRAGLPPPEDEDTRSEVEELREELAAIRGLRESGRAREAPERADAAVERARELDYEPALAEALVAAGEAHLSRQNAAEARSALEEGELVAELEGHDRARAEALVARVETESSFSSDHRATLELADRARAAIDRVGDDAVLSARLDRAVARVYRDQERYDDAEEVLRRALARYQGHDGDRSVRAVETTSELALILLHAGSFDEVVSLQREAVSTARRQLGEYHPTTRRVTGYLAAALSALGHYDEARELSERSGTFWPSGIAETMWRYASALFLEIDEGRELRGRVVDARGEAVAGAEVVVDTEAIIGDGKYARSVLNPTGLEDARMARSAEDGRFTLAGVAEADLLAVAEHPDHGRSLTTRVPEGESPEVRLELRPFGALEGKLRAPESADPVYAIWAVPEPNVDGGIAGAQVIAKPGELFAFERLPEGPHQVMAWGWGAGQRLASGTSAHVDIRPGETARLDIEIDAGLEVTVDVVSEDGRDIPASEVWALRGEHEFERLGELNRRLQRAIGDAGERGYAHPDRPAELRGVPAGRHTICAIPLPADRRDPQGLRELGERATELPVKCEPLELAPDLSEVSLEIEVPAPEPITAPGE